MIKNVSIRNFKSIKELDFKAKRVNVFIGEPNTGKSNILEALGMFSLHHRDKDVQTFPIRYQTVSNLFFDNETTQPLTVNVDNYSYQISGDKLSAFVMEGGKKNEFFEFNIREKKVLSPSLKAQNLPLKLYQFKTLESYIPYGSILDAPFGENLFGVLMENKQVKSLVSSLLKEKGYHLGLRIKESEIEVIKMANDILYTYPYQSLSDTLQRIIFYWAIIESNKDSTILLEEPESHMSPFYIRDIAERIARDTSNQYFLVTHNPYFLVTLVEKTKRADLSVSVTYLEDYQTKLKQLAKANLEELTELDTAIFFNLDKFTEVESVV